MKTRFPLWLAAFLLLAPPVRGDQDPAGDALRAAPQDPGPSQADSIEPMTLDDAGLNFSTVVESFIAGVSPNGYWLLKEKGTDRTWKLKLVSIDTKALRAAGAQRYAAPAVLRDVRDGQRLRVEFTVDFSGDQWKVAGMRLRPRKGGKKRR